MDMRKWKAPINENVWIRVLEFSKNKRRATKISRQSVDEALNSRNYFKRAKNQPRSGWFFAARRGAAAEPRRKTRGRAAREL